MWQRPPKEAVESLVGISRQDTIVTLSETNGGKLLTGYGTSDGKQRWSADIGYAEQGGIFHSGASDLVLAQSWDGETFIAVDARTGKTRWTRRASRHLSCGPSVLDDRPYAVC
ncbi:PQQ-binding-like beta-propeller repeat protein, partial [Streptomyces achromogenes]